LNLYGIIPSSSPSEILAAVCDLIDGKQRRKALEEIPIQYVCAYVFLEQDDRIPTMEEVVNMFTKLEMLWDPEHIENLFEVMAHRKVRKKSHPLIDFIFANLSA
jgi:hypothetical protein